MAKLENFRKLLLIYLFAVTAVVAAYSQVTVGAIEEPVQGAIFQMKTVDDNASDGGPNANLGMALPRVSLSDADNLYPMFLNDPTDPSSGANPLYKKDKADLDKSHTGLVVFNTEENRNADLEKGIYYWDGAKWQQMEKTPGEAEFTFDCNTQTGIVPEGTYIEKKELTSSNYLEIHAHVTAPGEYQFLATTNNGYYFSTSGFFPITGDFTIFAQAQGKPVSVQEDVLKILVNNEPVNCDRIKINVLTAAADYHIICDDAEVRGVYWVGKPLNPVNHYIKIHVNVLETGSYSISSDEIDGISFSGQGTFTTTGLQEVTLLGEGTPSSVLTKTVVFHSNSKGGQAMQCETKVHITIPQKRILDLGDNNHRLDTNLGLAKMFLNTANFGTEDRSTFKVETPIMYPNSEVQSLTLDVINSYIADNATSTDNHRPVDIIFMSYDANIASDQAVIDALVHYVKEGGLIIMLNEHMTTGANVPFIKQLFDNPAITLTSGDAIPGGKSFIQKIPDIDNEIFNGPFGDLRGKYCGSDNGHDDAFDWLPAEDLEWSVSTLNYNSDSDTSNKGSVNQTFMFKHKSLNFFWCGDGGYGSAGDGTVNNVWYPVALSGAPDYHPIPHTDYGNTNGSKTVSVYNGQFIANLLAWAMYQAEVNGINTK